jgi:integrase/recombinase XerD
VVQVHYRPFPGKSHEFDPNEVLALILSANPNLATQLRLRQLDNDTLFDTYINELRLRNLSANYINKVWQLLSKFKDYLNQRQPTPELAKSFLSQYFNHKQNTFVRYFTYVQGFMTWYGSKLDVKVKSPRMTPAYHTEEQIESLIEAAKNKKTHKKLALRDSLLIELAITTGLRRSELANIRVGDIDLINGRLQITGKGNKKRTIPLIRSIRNKLEEYCQDKAPYESLFGLKPACISNQIRILAKKAGVDLHTHSLRHYFGTKLVEKGANIRAVQELMGHSSLNTTQVYVGVTSRHLESAIKLLE